MFDLKSIKTKAAEDAKGYILHSEGLKTAIQMAIWLGKPLLLTGAPGTGKTRLAFKLADMLATEKNHNMDHCAPYLDKPFIFNTKTTSTATDLFYYYDAVRHFQKRYVDGNGSPAGITTAHPYIRLNALGKALVQAHGKTAIMKNDTLHDLQLLEDFETLQPEPRSSVVLIDEIDKAPRDFPNDLLNEIENMEFFINELMNKRVARPDSNAQVTIIMTSNFEKNLPDAFLRRCLFYHIPSPGPGELALIVNKRLEDHLKELYQGKDDQRYKQLLECMPENIHATVSEFEEIKKLIRAKQPATAELLDWIKTLEKRDFFNEKIDFKKLSEEKKKILADSVASLAKENADQALLRARYVENAN